MLAKLTALTVSVEFYLLSIPPMVWLGGPAGPVAAMAICQCMAISTYMTCVLKDILSCPRPSQLPAAGLASPRPAPPHDAADADAKPQHHHHQLRARVRADAASTVAAAATVITASSAGKVALPPPAFGGPRHISACPGVTVGVEVIGEAYRGEIEMGAPSMHTWCALVMPAYTAIVAQQTGVLSARRAAAVTVGAACWACWVAVSRLYLGVHTPVDLLLGAVSGAAMLGLWRCVGLAQMAAVGPALAAAAVQGIEPVPAWAEAATAAAKVSTAEYGAGGDEGVGLVALAAMAGMYLLGLATYPRPLSHTTSYDYAVIFLGAALGGLTSINSSASLLARMLRPPPAPGARSTRAAVSAVVAALPAALRHPAAVLLLGFIFVAFVKEASKVVLCALLPRLLELAPLRLRRLWQPPVHPAGCWYPSVEATALVELSGGPDGATECVPRDACGLRDPQGAEGKGDGKDANAGGGTDRGGGVGGGGQGVLMKTSRLPYDVDFLRKFLNYGLTVYAVVEFRHVAALLLAPQPS